MERWFCEPVRPGLCRLQDAEADTKTQRGRFPRNGCEECGGVIPSAAAFDSFLGFPNRGNSDSMFVHERGAASMGGAVAITRVELTAAELRAAAGREKDGSAARRMLALAMVLDGADRKSAAETCGMDRQTLRDWVHRYNAEGLRGLHDVKTPGPKPKLTAAQQAELAR